MLKLALTISFLLPALLSHCQKDDLLKGTREQNKKAHAIAKAWLKKYSDSLGLDKYVKFEELYCYDCFSEEEPDKDVFNGYKGGVYTKEQADSLLDLRYEDLWFFDLRGEHIIKEATLDTIDVSDGLYKTKVVKNKRKDYIYFRFDRKINLVTVEIRRGYPYGDSKSYSGLK